MPVYEIALTLSWFRIWVTNSSTKQILAPRISSTGLNHQSSASDLDSVEMAYDYATIGLRQGNKYTNNEYFMLVTLGYLAFKINQYRFLYQNGSDLSKDHTSNDSVNHRRNSLFQRLGLLTTKGPSA